MKINSIIQNSTGRCYLCGEPPEFGDPLDAHHVFGGALRKKSEKYRLTVLLHHNKCHIFGPQAVHRDAERNRALKAEAQKIAMKQYGWSVEDFRREFYKNYIEE